MTRDEALKAILRSWGWIVWQAPSGDPVVVSRGEATWEAVSVEKAWEAVLIDVTDTDIAAAIERLQRKQREVAAEAKALGDEMFVLVRERQHRAAA